MTFPVISFKGGEFDFHTSDVGLGRCTKTALKNGWFRGLTILDSDSVLYIVKDARFVRKTGEKTHPGLFASKWIEVDLDICEERRLDIEKVRQIIQRGLTASRGTWESAGHEFPELVRDIERAQSIEQIWNILTPLLTSGPALAESVNKCKHGEWP